MKRTSVSNFKTVVSLLIILGFSSPGFAEKENNGKSNAYLAKERCSELKAGYYNKKTKNQNKEWEKFGDHGQCVKHYLKIYEGAGTSGSCNTINESFEKNYRGFVDLCAKAAGILPGSWPRGLHKCLAQVAECSGKNENDSDTPSVIGALFPKKNSRCGPLQKIEDGRKNHPDSPQAKAEAKQADDQAKQAEKSRDEVKELRREKSQAYRDYIEKTAQRVKEAREKTEQLKDQKQQLVESIDDRTLSHEAEKQNLKTRIRAADLQGRQAQVEYLKSLMEIELKCRERAQAVGNQTVAGINSLIQQNSHRASGLGGALKYFGQGGADGQGNISANNLYQYCSIANIKKKISSSRGVGAVPSAQQQLIEQLKLDLKYAKEQAKEAKNIEGQKLRLQIEAIKNHKKNSAAQLALMDDKLLRVSPELQDDLVRMKHLFDKQQAELESAIAQAGSAQQPASGLQGMLQKAAQQLAKGENPLDPSNGSNQTSAKSEEDRDVIYQTLSRSAGLFHDAELLLQRCPCNADCGPEGLSNADGGENCQLAKKFYDMYTESFGVAGNCGEKISDSNSTISSTNRRGDNNRRGKSKTKRTK